MEFNDIYLYTLNMAVVVVFIGALIGCVIPVIPGPTMLAVMVLIHKLCFSEILPWGVVVFCAIIACLTQVGDFLLSWLGAKKYGATWRGAVGAVIGSVVAIFIPPQFITIFVFPFIFALGFEYIACSDFNKSVKAGWGAFLGGIIAMVFKVICCFAMIVAFTMYVF
ncbi:MAG: DUF456 domain-containing protein [Verrucomicrobiaceae bacterium]|nr:DUF456 domain-containing protein [Verrucomicrobiaceae bacterium]